MEVDKLIDRTLAKHRESGILLHRPYPPLGLPRVRSRLGGLPTLPEGIEWPYGRSPYDGKAVPLHFLAQIDCAELPPIDARMPEEGILFFFARDDEEQVWGYGGSPLDDGRVIYARSVADDQGVRTPPAGLLPIRDRGVGFDPVLPKKAGPSVHLSWPLIAMEFDTWPDSSALARPLGYAYDDRLERQRIVSFSAATGLSPDSLNPSPEWQKDLLPNRPFMLPNLAPIGIAIQCISYEIIAEVLKRKADATSPEARQIMTEARSWIDRARMIGLDKIAPAKEMVNFEAWLTTFAQLNERDREPPPLADKQARQKWFNEWPLVSKLRCAMPQIFAQALTDSIAFLAGSPASAALVPAEVYSSMENRFSPLGRRKLRTHQMLGHAPATQEAMGVDSDLICLLQLVSEEALGMTFGDAGEVAFWISGDDLTRGRFDNAKIRLQGH